LEVAMNARTTLVEALLDSAWRQWTTLGVAGVEGIDATGGVAIDLEALLLLTAPLFADDPRLRDEVLDWCVRSHRFISKPRLKQLVKLASQPTQAAFTPFTRALQHRTGGVWPLMAQAELEAPWGQLSGKSSAPDLQHPALLNLKLRALFGVGARADVIAAILNWPAPDFGASDLVFVGYTKRNLADALDALADGGLLVSTRVGNRLRFSWRRRAELCRVLGPLPGAIPRWPPITRVLAGFLELLGRTQGKSERVSLVEAVREFGRLSADFTALSLQPPRATSAPLDWLQVMEWMLTNALELARGRHGGTVKAA
jgi:hypothetical protein